jgi:hypothetical protein
MQTSGDNSAAPIETSTSQEPAPAEKNTHENDSNDKTIPTSNDKNTQDISQSDGGIRVPVGDSSTQTLAGEAPTEHGKSDGDSVKGGGAASKPEISSSVRISDSDSGSGSTSGSELGKNILDGNKHEVGSVASSVGSSNKVEIGAEGIVTPAKESSVAENANAGQNAVSSQNAASSSQTRVTGQMADSGQNAPAPETFQRAEARDATANSNANVDANSVSKLDANANANANANVDANSVSKLDAWALVGGEGRLHDSRSEFIEKDKVSYLYTCIMCVCVYVCVCVCVCVDVKRATCMTCEVNLSRK